MTYATALAAAWATFTGTTDVKLLSLNALTVPGANVDVAPSSVVAYLALNGKLAPLLKYAATPPANAAGVAAANLAAVLSIGTNAPVFGMSNPTTYATIAGMLAAIVADSNSGLTSTDGTALLALAAGAPIPWWQSVGRSGPVNMADIVAAGLA